EVMAKYPQLETKRAIAETIRSMINTLVLDLTEATRAKLNEYQPDSVDALRQCPPLATFSPEIRAQADELKRFLLHRLYRHPRVTRMTNKARRIVRDLFVAFLEEPRLLAYEHQKKSPLAQARAIADYIAGMTDRYAIKEHRELFRMD